MRTNVTRRATHLESEAFRAREEKDTRDETKVPRDSFNVDRSLLVTKTEVKFNVVPSGSVINCY